jgi:hypothetical protein
MPDMNNYLPGKKKSLILHDQAVNQKIWKQNQKKLASKPYGKYFKRDLYVYDDALQAINNGPIAVEDALTPASENLNKLLDKGYLPGETGYCEMPDGSLYSSSLTWFPNCTPEMFQWWFWWHSAESERYTIWYPYSHVSASVRNKNVLTQPGLTDEQRYIGNTHVITEYLEKKRNNITITFVNPADLGFDTSRFEEAGIKAHACGIVKLQRPDVVFCTMIHLVRETENGFELRSRYFIGSDVRIKVFGRYRKLPKSIVQLLLRKNGGLQLAYDQVLHDQVEFTNLASILPELYREFSKR